MKLPVSQKDLEKVLGEMGIEDVSRTTIRQCSQLGSILEENSGEKFSHLEFGIPGIPACPIGIEAQKKALDAGVPSIYPSVHGLPELKQNASTFVKAFIGIDINPKGIVPTVGSMQGSMTSILLCSQLQPGKDTILYICPGFSPHGRQPDLLGIKNIFFDIYEYRAEKLRDKLESYFKQGNIAAILYSNPNNPAWICLTEEELQIIGELATKYDVVVLEDMAYLCMDFRKDMSVPFQPPYQSTVARYTDNYVIFLSGSKIFSYAGERIAVVCISDKLYQREYPAMKKRWGIGRFGDNFILNYLYVNTSGASHSAQYALCEMFRAACDGEYNFRDDIKIYGERAHKLKEVFCRHNFYVVYDKDLDQPIADGFYFTIGYPGMTSGELARELMYYGVSAINLGTTGSDQQGLRVCTSFIQDHQYAQLDERMQVFAENHPVEK